MTPPSAADRHYLVLAFPWLLGCLLVDFVSYETGKRMSGLPMPVAMSHEERQRQLASLQP